MINSYDSMLIKGKVNTWKASSKNNKLLNSTMGLNQPLQTIRIYIYIYTLHIFSRSRLGGFSGWTRVCSNIKLNKWSNLERNSHTLYMTTILYWVNFTLLLIWHIPPNYHNSIQSITQGKLSRKGKKANILRSRK